MVKIKDGQAIMNFGTGDICIAGGNLNDTSKGYVFFVNQTAREIGSKGIVKPYEEFRDSDMDVIMTFTDSKSIDVLIGQLLEAKEVMDK